MNSAIEQVIVAVGSSWALSTLVKATFIMLFGLLAVWLLNRKRAALRHTLLAGTFGVLLILPGLSVISPAIGIRLREPQARGLAARRTPAIPAPSPVLSRPLSANERPSNWPIATMLGAAWIAGVIAFLLPMFAGLWKVLSVRTSCAAWANGRSVAEQYGRRAVEVLLAEELTGPMACGVLRPAIVLPADAPTWKDEDLNRAIVHELEHVARRDWAIHCIARAICAIYWFHPLVWMLWRRLDLEAERACDDAVLKHSDPAAYADQLVAAARRFADSGRSPLIAMAGRADLSARVRAVLDNKQRRGRAGVLSVITATVTAVAVALVISPIRVVAAPQAAAPSSAFRSTTTLVLLPVTVSGADGNAVDDLKANDFQILEDGVPQRITLFEVHPQSDPSAYLLAYYPSKTENDGKFRDIVVRIALPSVTVRARRGYFMQSNATAFDPAPGVVNNPNETPPVVIFKVEPAYPEAAIPAKWQGSVTLDVTIDKSGHPQNIRVARTLGFGFDESAIEAVERWRFKPAMSGGSPVESRTQVVMSFQLR